MGKADERWHIFVTKIIFAFVVFLGRYVLYLLIVKALHEACALGYNLIRNRRIVDQDILIESSKKYVTILIAAAGVLIYFKEKLEHDYFFIFIASLITKYPEMDGKQSINYGVGMACSFFEGYLAHIIPSDGARFVGFEENINIYEAKQKVIFPVKKLFIIITKSLYCPPDLKQFNKKDKSLPYLEACQSLEDVEKDVAGVKNRTYRNSAYKIHRGASPPVYLAAECATPLHTLHRVLERRALYEELGKVDVKQVVDDFCATLRTVIDKSPDCRGKCQLVYFDDEDPSQNLSEVLLENIRQLEPNFEHMVYE